MKLTFNINSSLLGFHVNGQKPDESIRLQLVSNRRAWIDDWFEKFVRQKDSQYFSG